MLNSGRNWWYFVLCDLEIWWMTLENNRTPFLYYIKLCASFQIHRWSLTWVTVRKGPIWVKIDNFLSRPLPRDLEISFLTLKNNRAPLLYYIKLCAPFQSHGWIQTVVTVRKLSIQVKISKFLCRVTLKFDGWPWKTIGHLSYAASNFVHPFIAIGEFKTEFQSGNAQFGSKSMIFFSRVTLKFDGWPWKTIGHLFQATSNFVLHFIAICEFKLELRSGNG